MEIQRTAGSLRLADFTSIFRYQEAPTKGQTLCAVTASYNYCFFPTFWISAAIPVGTDTLLPPVCLRRPCPLSPELRLLRELILLHRRLARWMVFGSESVTL
jgi:hypothetical protein